MKVARLLLSLVLPAAVACSAAPPRVPADEFGRLYRGGEVVVLDVRSAGEYVAGHIPGAILAPLIDLEARAADLRRLAKPVVTYCSCPAEESSLAAAAAMARLGIKGVRALTGGFDGWVSGGGAVVKGDRPL